LRAKPTTLDPDADLIPRLAAGDQTALSELMDRRLKTLHGLAARLLSDAGMAEDVAQTVLTNALISSSAKVQFIQTASPILRTAA